MIAAPLDTLTPRQTEVLGLLAAGQQRKQIAAELRMSPATVAGHCRSIYQRLTARNATVAVQVAHARGLLPTNAGG